MPIKRRVESGRSLLEHFGGLGGGIVSIAIGYLIS